MYQLSHSQNLEKDPTCETYLSPSVRVIPVSLEAALLTTSLNSGEITPGTEDDWGEF